MQRLLKSKMTMNVSRSSDVNVNTSPNKAVHRSDSDVDSVTRPTSFKRMIDRIKAWNEATSSRGSDASSSSNSRPSYRRPTLAPATSSRSMLRTASESSMGVIEVHDALLHHSFVTSRHVATAQDGAVDELESLQMNGTLNTRRQTQRRLLLGRRKKRSTSLHKLAARGKSGLESISAEGEDVGGNDDDRDEEVDGSHEAGDESLLVLRKVLSWMMGVLRPTEVCRSLTLLHSAEIIDANTRRWSFFSGPNHDLSVLGEEEEEREEEEEQQQMSSSSISEATGMPAAATNVKKMPVRYYLAVISNRLSGVEESALFVVQSPTPSGSELGIVKIVPVWSDLDLQIKGDGAFEVSVAGESVVIGTPSIYSMWSAIGTVQRARAIATGSGFSSRGNSHGWVDAYSDLHRSATTKTGDSKLSLVELHNDTKQQQQQQQHTDSLNITNKPKKPRKQNRTNDTNIIASNKETIGGPDVTVDPNPTPIPAVLITRPLPDKLTLNEALRQIVGSATDPDSLTTRDVISGLEERFGGNLVAGPARPDGYSKAYLDEEILRVYGQLEPASLIMDQLYLGTEYNASNKDELTSFGVNHVVNVTFEIPNFFPNMYDYLKIPIKDLPTSNVLMHLHYACEYIEQALAGGSAVLVHCQRGVSRSASVVIAYVMKSQRMPLVEAIKFVCKRRSCVRPNDGFVKQLVEFEASLEL